MAKGWTPERRARQAELHPHLATLGQIYRAEDECEEERKAAKTR